MAPTQGFYAQSLPRAMAGFAETFSPEGRRLAEGLHEYIAEFWRCMSEGPFTVVHGDFRLENLLFGTEAAAEGMRMVDLQLCIRARGPFDLAYLMSQSAPVDLRRRAERRILERYHGRLLDRGVEGYDFDACLRDYRKSVLYCLTYPVIVCGSLDASNPSARAFGTSYLGRQLTAMADWRCSELL